MWIYIPCVLSSLFRLSSGLSDEAHCRYHVLETSFIGRRLGGIGTHVHRARKSWMGLATVYFFQMDYRVRCVRDGL